MKRGIVMIDSKENELINIKLDTLYKKYTPDFLDEWNKAFDDVPPSRINQFGIIDIQQYDNTNAILFICKETNGWDNEDYSNGCLFRQWMCDITKNGIEGKAHPNMWYNIGRWIMLMNNPEKSLDEIACIKSEAIQYIGKIAFTNINKVRGKKDSKKEYNQLAKTPVVGEVLRKEIEIINPKIIVCCGTGWVFDKHVSEFSGKIIYMPHPGARTSTEKMLMQLKEQL